jgi:hypothetical protein
LIPSFAITQTPEIGGQATFLDRLFKVQKIGGQATFLDRLFKVHGSFSIFLMPAFPPAFGGFVGSGWTRFSSTVSGNSTTGR